MYSDSAAVSSPAQDVSSTDLRAMKSRDDPSSGYLNTVYFASWSIYDRGYDPNNLPADKISHVLYAFAKFDEDGTIKSFDPFADTEKLFPGDVKETGVNVYGCVKQLYLLKKKHRKMKVMLSVGGWSLSANFPKAASTPENRERFADSAVEFVKNWGLDGIDVDWEYPSDENEARNMVLLLKIVREKLDDYSSKYADKHHFQLSIAAPAGPDKYNKLHLKELGDVLDHIYLMAYDYAGSWSRYSGHDANLYHNPHNPNATPFNTDQAVKAYLNGGVPPEKLILGMPIYGRSFQYTDGIGQLFDGVGGGSWEGGVWDYKVLPKSGASIKHDRIAKGDFSYNEETRELISFDTVDMVNEKITYLKEKSMGGGMFWEASADHNDDKSLIAASYQALGNADSTQNWLDYPNSIYENMKKGMPSK